MVSFWDFGAIVTNGEAGLRGDGPLSDVWRSEALQPLLPLPQVLGLALIRAARLMRRRLFQKDVEEPRQLGSFVIGSRRRGSSVGQRSQLMRQDSYC